MAQPPKQRRFSPVSGSNFLQMLSTRFWKISMSSGSLSTPLEIWGKETVEKKTQDDGVYYFEVYRMMVKKTRMM